MKVFRFLAVGALIIGLFLVSDGAEKKVIGVANQWLGNDWNRFCYDAIVERLQELGYEVIGTNALGVTSQQVADVATFIARKVDGIIIKGGEGPAFVDVAKEAFEAGIPVVAVDMYLDGAVVNIASNNWVGGVYLGLYMVNYMHRSGKYIILDTPGWHTLMQRREAALTVFKFFPAMVCVGSYEVGTTDPVQEAYNITKQALRAHPDLKGVLCTWGLPVVGAAQAVIEMGKQDQVVLVSADSDRPVLEIMGRPDAPPMANIGQLPKLLGRLAAEYIDQAVRIGDVRKAIKLLPPLVFGPTYMISNRDPGMDFSEIFRVTPDKAWEIMYLPEYEKPWK
ncbi:MAG: sugar ABC transporter substrate-binding protein [Candidatus Hadarchaeum sp.]|uniref:sugar ABC transporter substrate-binding protein n=1 Tax=Candidatus Hadarchaeum sp. TaxID=2883567 RepID=UPI00316FC889